MKISIAATNPCHLYGLALALYEHDCLAAWYSGYPSWRLPSPKKFPFQSHSARTLITYAANRLPSFLRPDMLPVFLWQDDAFDRWVAGRLQQCDFYHALPGQALHAFRRAREMGVQTVLNHASGPVWRQNEAVAHEYARVGLPSPAKHHAMPTLESRHRKEYALADFHCVASSLVREQLMAEGVPDDRIWISPYGVDPQIFNRGTVSKNRSASISIVFAGQLVLRKGLKTLLDALELLPDLLSPARRNLLSVQCFGSISTETQSDFHAYGGVIPVERRGPVAQKDLAAAFQGASVCVLPSWEEAFGLVVPQALACGRPCIVSDRVGAKDLIQNRVNGSVFAAGDHEALAGELAWWINNPKPVMERHDWKDGAQSLLTHSRKALNPSTTRMNSRNHGNYAALA